MPFGRLVESVIEFSVKANFKQEIFIQAGVYKTQLVVPQNVSIFDFATQERINELIERSDILITHGGTGSIIGSLGGSRKVILVMCIQS
jgi:UDP-N-acetylglucosamine transferase subunit ALG13